MDYRKGRPEGGQKKQGIRIASRLGRNCFAILAIFLAAQPRFRPPAASGSPKNSTSALDPGPKQTDIPILLQVPKLILASDKPPRKTSYPPQHVIYSVPETGNVLLASELHYYKNLKVDIYYPPDYNFTTKLPVVILAHGFQETDEFDKDMQQHVDWAKLIAAYGMIAVSAQAADAPEANSFRVLDFMKTNEKVLGFDLTRMGYWACSGQGKPMFKAFEDKNLFCRDALKVGLLFYMDFGAAVPADWPANIALFVVKAGKDNLIPGKTIDNFVSKVRALNIATEYIELADAPHAFDVSQNTQAKRDVIKESMEFLKSKLRR